MIEDACKIALNHDRALKLSRFKHGLLINKPIYVWQLFVWRVMVPFPWPVHLHSVHDRHVGVERSNMIIFRRGSVDTRVGLDKAEFALGLLSLACINRDLLHASVMFDSSCWCDQPAWLGVEMNGHVARLRFFLRQNGNLFFVFFIWRVCFERWTLANL